MRFSEKKILLIDDQPPAVAWLKEYLESSGAIVEIEPSFSNALSCLKQSKEKFDLITIDLMMPITGVSEQVFSGKSPLYNQFPGLFLAMTARNLAYGSNSVLLYSVQDTDEIEAESKRIGVGYCVKGRPRDLKARIDALLLKRGS